MQQAQTLFQAQKDFFATGATLRVDFRLAQLQKLEAALTRREGDILQALSQDLNKSPLEGYMSEIGIVRSELRHAQKHLRRWTRPRRVPTPLAAFPARSAIRPEPYGCVLVIAPWNYPFQLTLSPLIGAIAAGNCAVVKPSNNAPATARLIESLLSECFEASYIATVQGGREANGHLLDLPFDYLFFTGGITVGKVVMEAAAKHLTPMTLELGGKSPCIVDETADLDKAARRIAWGKCLNAGQTCVAPDYLLVHENVKDRLLSLIAAQFQAYFGERPEHNPTYPKMVNQKHFDRVNGLIAGSGSLYWGGASNPDTRQIAPTLLTGVTWEDPVMGEEIFGPVLPVLTFATLEEAAEQVKAHPKPLALYYFSTDKKRIDWLLETVPFGGGCVNETIMHLVSSDLPFGGVGQSGMGAYHGKASFDTFTHYKSVVHKANWLEISLRYAPFDTKKLGLVKKLMR